MKGPDGYDDDSGDRTWFDSDTDVAPPVITAGSAEQPAKSLGDVVYVPTMEEMSPGDENATLKLSHTSGGQLAALAYSSLEQLVRCCGVGQPWVAFRSERIDALPGVAGADVLLWDEELPAEQRMDVDDNGPG